MPFKKVLVTPDKPSPKKRSMDKVITCFGDIRVVGETATITSSVELKVSFDYQSAGTHKSVTCSVLAEEADTMLERLSDHLRSVVVQDIPHMRKIIEKAVEER